MRALDFAVQGRGSGTDLDVSDTHVEQVPMKRRAEFLTVVRLNILDLKRQLREDVFHELDRDLLVVARIGPQNPQSRAVIDCDAEGRNASSSRFSQVAQCISRRISRPLVVGGRGVVSRSVSTGSVCVCSAKDAGSRLRLSLWGGCARHRTG